MEKKRVLVFNELGEKLEYNTTYRRALSLVGRGRAKLISEEPYSIRLISLPKSNKVEPKGGETDV